MGDSNSASPIVVEANISGQPGPSGVQPEPNRQPASTNNSQTDTLSETLADMNSSMSAMTTLLQRIFARQDRRHEDMSDDEEDDEPVSKRQRDDDELSTTASDEDIARLINPAVPESQAEKPDAGPEDFIKSLEAEFSESVPVGPKVNDSLANIAKKRWGIILPNEKLKPLLEKHAQPENCQLHVAQVNKEIWEQLENHQKKADKRLQNIQESLQKASFALLKSTEPLIGKTSDEDKKALSQNIDAIALLGHAAGDITCLRRERIKPLLKPEYASLCSKESNEKDSKYLFGDDLAKQVRDAKETSAIGKKLGVFTHKKPIGVNRPYYNKHDPRDSRNISSGKGYYNQDHYNKDRFLGKGFKKPQGKSKGKK